MFIQHWSQSSSLKKILYLSQVHSQLTYCSQIWHLHLLKKIQRRENKYILNDFTSDYRSPLIALKILPLMMQLEIYDVVFFIRSLKGPTDAFNIYDHVTFQAGSTHSTHAPQVEKCFDKNCARHFYFNRMPRLCGTLDLPLT